MSREKITIYGKRLKEEAKRHGMTCPDMAELLGYSLDGKQISAIYSGYRKLSDDRFATLSKTWGVREDYLRCNDDWRTDEDALAAAHLSDTEHFSTCLKYLESLGVHCSLRLSSLMPLIQIEQQWDLIANHLTEKSRAEVLANPYFSTPWSAEKINDRIHQIKIYWNTPPDNIPLVSESQIGVEGNASSAFIVSNSKSVLGYTTGYGVEFSVTYKDKYYGEFPISQLQAFVQRLNAVTDALVIDMFGNTRNYEIFYTKPQNV